MNLKGISSLIGGFILHLMIGCFYLWGMINIYVTSYYRIKGETYLKTSLSAGLFPVFLLFVAITFFFGVGLAEKYTYKKSMFFQSLGITLSIFISSFMPDFWSFLLFFSIGYGIFSGLLYLLPIYLCSKYYPSNKGLVSGIILSGNGIASLLGGRIAQAIINPNNDQPIKELDGSGKYFDSSIADNVPKFIRYLSLYFLGISIIGSLLSFDFEKIDNPSINNGIDSNNSVGSEIPHKIQLLENKVEISMVQKIKENLKTFDYFALFFMNLCSSGFGLLITVQYKDYGLEYNYDDETLNLIGSIGLVFNSFGRILYGWLMDRFGFKKVYGILLIIQIVLICSLHRIVEIKICFFIWICLILICEGGHFALFPAATMKQFGIKMGGFIYPFVYFSFCISNFIQFFIVLGLKSKIEYQNIFWIYAGFTFISFILVIFFKEKQHI